MYKAGSYSQNVSSVDSKTVNDFGGDWHKGNPNFSDDNSTHLKAKDMAQQQLDKRKFNKTVIPET